MKITCEHCGATINIEKEKVCSSCNAPYNKNKEYLKIKEEIDKNNDLDIKNKEMNYKIKEKFVESFEKGSKSIKIISLIMFIIFAFAIGIFTYLFISDIKDDKNVPNNTPNTTTQNNTELYNEEFNELFDETLNQIKGMQKQYDNEKEKQKNNKKQK